MSTWYAVLNDLSGGWAIGNQDKPLSEYDFRGSAMGRDLILADSLTEQDARAIVTLLNEHGYPNCYADLGEGE